MEIHWAERNRRNTAEVHEENSLRSRVDVLTRTERNQHYIYTQRRVIRGVETVGKMRHRCKRTDNKMREVKLTVKSKG